MANFHAGHPPKIYLHPLLSFLRGVAVLNLRAGAERFPAPFPYLRASFSSPPPRKFSFQVPANPFASHTCARSPDGCGGQTCSNQHTCSVLSGHASHAGGLPAPVYASIGISGFLTCAFWGPRLLGLTAGCAPRSQLCPECPEHCSHMLVKMLGWSPTLWMTSGCAFGACGGVSAGQEANPPRPGARSLSARAAAAASGCCSINYPGPSNWFGLLHFPTAPHVQQLWPSPRPCETSNP